MSNIIAIFATTLEGAIGNKNELIHKDPIDLQHFKEITEDGVVIMGRKTYLSLGSKPLPNRKNIVLSTTFAFPELNIGCPISLDEAIGLAKDEYPGKNIYIIGGAEVLKEAFEKEYIDFIYHTSFKCYAKEFDAKLDFSYESDYVFLKLIHKGKTKIAENIEVDMVINLLASRKKVLELAKYNKRK